MVHHVVMWRVDGSGAEGRESAVAEIASLLESLPEQVPGIRGLEVGVNALPGDMAADVMVSVKLDEWNALRDYAVHPAHVRVAARIGALTVERRSVDYELL